MSKATVKQSRTGAGSTLAVREATMEAFTALVLQVPEAAPGDIADLLGPILAASSWEQLQEESTLPNSKLLAQTGTRVRVDAISRKPSDQPTNAGFYLLCEAVNLATGEQFRFTAGGDQAVAVLSQLHVLRALPAYVHFAFAKTSGGNDAVNCLVDGRDPSRTIDG